MNMNNIMKQLKNAQKIQASMMKAQEELGERVFQGTAGGGAVKISMNGHKNIQAVVIDKEVVQPDDVEMLQDLIVAAFQDVFHQVDEVTQQELGKYTQGLNLPNGLF
jgi:nucleoid-associated protein EbfC